jgi:hypothetical protein
MQSVHRAVRVTARGDTAAAAASATRALPRRCRCAAPARGAPSTARSRALPAAPPPLHRGRRRAGRAAPLAAGSDHGPPGVPPVAAPTEDDDAMSEEALKRNDTLVREAPIYAGVAGVVLLLLNRILSGGALVMDAASTQSRADVLVLAMATASLLTVRCVRCYAAAHVGGQARGRRSLAHDAQAHMQTDPHPRMRGATNSAVRLYVRSRLRVFARLARARGCPGSPSRRARP